MADIAALGISVDSSPVVQATGALEQMNAEATKSPTAISRITTATDSLIAALNRNVSATDALANRMAAMEAAGSKAATSLDRVDVAARTATTNVVQFTGATDKARTNLDATAQAADRMTQAWQRLGAAGAEVSKMQTPEGFANFRMSNLSGDGSVPMQQGAAVAGRNGRLSAFQAQNLFYQGTDVIASAASGMSPLTIALQQGGQIAPTFMGPGGASLGGVFSQVTEGIGGLASRIGLLGGAATAGVAAVAALVIAQQNYASSQMAIARTLATGQGRLSGATPGEINAIAAAGGGDLSTGARRDYATQLAGAGVNSSLYGGLLGSLKDYAATTGQDQATALSSLGQAFADPAKGAEALNKQLGFLDAATLENIQRLQAQGDKLSASKMLLDAYSGSLVKASELTGGWARVTESVLTPIANLWDKIGEKVDKVVNGGSLDQQIASAFKTLQAAQAASEGGLGFFSSRDVERAQQAYDKLVQQQSQQARRTQVAQQSQSSLALDATLRSLNPQNEAFKQLEDQAKAIRRPFMENWIDPDARAQAALQGLAAQTKQMREDMALGGAQYADAIRAAQFSLKTVDYSPQAQAVAQIRQQREQRDIDANRRASLDTSNDQYLDKTGLDRALESNKREMDLRLQEQRQRDMTATSNNSGSYAIGLAQVPAQFRDLIRDNANRVGNISPDLLASVLRQESGNFDPRVISGQKLSPAGAQGIGQFMPDTVRGMGGFNPFDPAQAIAKSAELLSQLKTQYGNDDVSALVGYNATTAVRRRFQAADRDVSVLPKETQDYIQKIMTPSPSAKAALEEQVARNRAIDDERQKLTALEADQGRNTASYRAQVEKIEQLSAAQAKNQNITTSGIALIEREAKARQDLQTASQFQSFMANDNFSRDQLGRTREDQAAASAARPYQDTSYYDRVFNRTRDTNSLTDAKQMVTDGATSFVTALRRGASASDALASAFGSAADKLLSKAVDSLVSGGFSALTGGGGSGGSGGFLSSIFGGGAGAASGLPDFKFFSSGGYTGDGGKYDPRGIVHAGEVVFSQADVARFGGAAVVERMRMGYPGYASGGVVGGGVAPVTGPANNTNIQVNMQGSSGDPQKDDAHVQNTVKAMRAEMDSVAAQHMARALATNGTLWKAGVRRAGR